VLRLDNVVCIEGSFSVREDENASILISRVRELPDDQHYTETPRKTAPIQAKQVGASRETAPRPQKPPRILYLRVPDLTGEPWQRTKNLLEIFEGALPVSVFDASTKHYQNQPIGFDCTAYTVGELKKLLGDENVVLK
jgi:DNA polymerase-3 subunit alpha